MTSPPPPSASPSSGDPLLVYDGECAFCSRAVQFLLRHDRRRRTLRFATRVGTAGSAVRVRHPGFATVQSLLWVEVRDGAERVLAHSDAVLAALEYLGGGWVPLARTARVVPRPLRDGVYATIARYRRRVFRGAAFCPVPPPGAAARLLD